MAKCWIEASKEISKSKTQSRYYIHFRTDKLGEVIECFYPLSYGLNRITVILLQG